MGLINLFNAMALRPHIPYRFKAEIWPNYQNAYDNNDKIFRPLEFTIKRISQPVFKLDTENKVNFGNTVFVVPILKFGDTTMEITFEETDDMRVFKTLSGLMGNELFKGVNSGLLNIRITQFDETMLTISDKKTYICRLKEYGTPSFNNNGHGSPIEISATFKVVYVVEEPTVLEEIKDGYRVIIREKLPENERIINEAQTVADEEDKQKMSKGDFDKKMRDRKIMDVLKAEQIKTSAGVAEQAMIAMGYDPTKESQVKMFDAELKMRNINLDDGLNNTELKTLTQMVKDYVDPQYATEDLLSNLNENINALEKLNNEYNSYLSETTKQPEAKLPKEQAKYVTKTSASDVPTNSKTSSDFIVTQSELDANLARIHKKGFTNVTMDALRDVSLENAKRMDKAYTGFKTGLENSAYTVSINTYNDPNHGVGIGTQSGSHILGQKVDLTFYKNGKKITLANATAEDRKYLSDVANKNGLLINWETSGKAGSGWGDVALQHAMSINKKGEVVELNATKWTKDDQYFDSGRNKQIAFTQ